MFENKHLFSARDRNGAQSNECHLAQMVAVLGPPPVEFIRRTETSQTYFDCDGNWKPATQVPNLSLEMSERRLEGKKKSMFLQFIRKMLQWVPEKRHTAKQLLEDPWLRS